MKKYFVLVLFIIPFFSVSQVQIGSDINGKNIGDHSGYSISLSSNGNIIAISSHNTDVHRGMVTIYRNVSGVWMQIGNDINGESEEDYFGYNLSLSSDGSIVAIGGYNNNGNGQSSGHVRIYKNINDVWTQIGNDIDGESAGDYSGYSVSLSSDGEIVAIGSIKNNANGNNDSGHVRVYKNNNSIWEQVGSSINGKYQSNNFGHSVSLSSDGSTVAIKSRDGSNISPPHSISGYVGIYKNISGTWTQIGNDIHNSIGNVSLSSDGSIVVIGTEKNDGVEGYVKIYKNNSDTWIQVGSDIDFFVPTNLSISSNGSIVAIGASSYDNNSSSNVGIARIYQNISNNWSQIGNDIYGENTFDFFGNSISLSSDGSIVAIGGDGNNGNGINSGYVQIYNLSTVLSTSSFIINNTRLYPNPVNKEFTIKLTNGLLLKKVIIYNSLGKLILKSKKNNIDTRNLTQGLYLIKIITNKGNTTKKIIVN